MEGVAEVSGEIDPSDVNYATIAVGDLAAKRLGVQFLLAGQNAPFLATNYSNAVPNILTVGGAIASVLYPFLPGSHYQWIARLLGIIVLGGMGSLPGAVIGALCLGVAELMTVTYIGPEWATGVPYVFVFIVLLLRPQGLLGMRLRQDVATA